MKNILGVLQILVSIGLITAILLQQKGTDGSAILGGSGSGGGNYYAKRGFEKILFVATIILATLFTGLALVSLFV